MGQCYCFARIEHKSLKRHKTILLQRERGLKLPRFIIYRAARIMRRAARRVSRIEGFCELAPNFANSQAPDFTIRKISAAELA